MNMKIMRRLTPLYATAFFQGFVLWYATEKLFMTTIGLDSAAIGLVTALVALVVILFETPSGILADRWSRKGVLILGSIALMLACLLGGSSQGVIQYAIATSLWSVFFALYSGTYDSIVYDTLLEEQGDAKSFSKYYGRVRVMDSVALVTGSLTNIIVAQTLGLRATYFLTIPITSLSIITALKFREPTLHKRDVNPHLLKHTLETFRAISTRGIVLWILLTSVFLGLGGRLVFEFNQLWFIALGLPLAAYGLLTAFLQSSLGIGGLLAPYLERKRFALMAFTGLVVSTIGLLSTNRSIAVPALILSLTLFLTLDIVVLHQLHARLSSHIRAGAASAISTCSQILTIPAAILFGVISQSFSVYAAGGVVVAAAAVAFISFFGLQRASKITATINS